LQYGIFLSEILNEWVHKDVGEVFVQTFDGVLSSWLTGSSPLCIFSRTCGNGVALEHNGDLYSCDHYVEPDYLLGNIMKTPLKELVTGEQQRKFGNDKASSLPGYCRKCEYLFACHGECPKNRILDTPEGEQGLNYLCSGLKHFFKYSDPYMRVLAELLRKGQTAADIMPILVKRYEGVGRNELCPCGSGNKFKNCHSAQ
jgi:uncharacterized protein